MEEGEGWVGGREGVGVVKEEVFFVELGGHDQLVGHRVDGRGAGQEGQGDEEVL